jgi:hypothetical protein
VHLRQRLLAIRRRFDRALLVQIVQAALTAGAAWELALQLPNHGQPFFAPIAAVIALGAQRGTRGLFALQMIVGVALGILIGAGVVAIGGAGWWQVIVAVLVSMLAGIALSPQPIVRNQAAASAVLIVALHRPGSNLALQRLVDALIGGGLAIVVAQLLFPIEPLELVRREARRVRDQLADALLETAEALRTRDRGRAERALAQVDSVDERRLYDALALARQVARRAPRRRRLRPRLEPLDAVVHELDAASADARAVITGSLRALGDGRAPPAAAADAVEAAAGAIRTNDPDDVAEWTTRARNAARAARQEDDSLGVGVVAHGVDAIAAHAVDAARRGAARSTA